MDRTIGALSLIALLAPSAAEAQDSEGGFSAQYFQPAMGPRNWLTVEGARVEGSGAWSAAALATYELNPFVVYPARCAEPLVDGLCPAGNYELLDQIAVVQHQIVTHLMGTISFGNRIQIGLDLPVAFTSGNEMDAETATVAGDVSAFGLADPRLHGKYRVFGRGRGFGLAGSLEITTPFSDAVGVDREGHLGNDLPLFVPKVIVDWQRKRLAFGANLGVRLRYEASQQFSSEVGTEVLYGLAGSYRFAQRYTGILEVFGSSTPPFQVDVSPIEADLGVRASFGHFRITAGGGLGITSAIGSPDVRVFVGALYHPQEGDRDHDGIDDSSDQCPDDDEDVDGFLDSDGCPEEDNDADGIDDERDRCPDEPEDMDGYEDLDGCPDEDNDGDGISDGYDSCPNVPEDMDGDRDDDGCPEEPEEDADADGIQDVDDECPEEAEDTDGFEDEDGCPDLDNDEDGVPDERDECPEEKEDIDHFQDEDGCPERGGRIRGRRRRR